MSEQMVFPETFDEFAEQYKLVDTKQVYTNGTELIPVFRVRQWLMRPDPLAHNIKSAKSEAVKEFAERLKNEIINDTAYACDITQHSGYYDYQIKIGDIPEYIDNLVKEMVGEDNSHNIDKQN